ncbi:MAG TPA: DUF4911 domain-containing protein [Candidatus Binataceae bacterium]|nr:DUF4911 domain-containing protein [Candidatus Binataceae bacterium]
MPRFTVHRGRSMSSECSNKPPAAMSTIVLELPPARIAAFKAIIESYDNLATLRTEDPRRHRLKLYFAPESAHEVEALVDSLTAQFSIRRLTPSGAP